MKINIEKAKEEFIKYTEKYNLEEPHIKNKQEHSLRVMERAKEIAEKLQLNKEDIELATLIGLLHDIARFEQYTKYKTFVDRKSIDHGNLGAEIIEKEIRKYIETNEYDEIIKKAIKHHNKFAIEEKLTPREELHAKIIRDADKLDIFYEAVNIFNKGQEEEIGKEKISKQMVEQFEKQKPIHKTGQEWEKGILNKNIVIIAFIYDMNYKLSFEILKKEDYINKIIQRYNIQDKYSKEQMEKIKKEANKYIENKIIE